MGAGEIVLHPAEAGGAGGSGHAADAGGGVAHGGDGGGGLLRRLDEGHEQGLGADVEVLLDQHRVVLGRPHDRRDRIGRHGLQLSQGGLDPARRVFGVEQQPVEARAGHGLGGVGTGEGAPQADLGLAGQEALLEAVDGQVHLDPAFHDEAP